METKGSVREDADNPREIRLASFGNVLRETKKSHVAQTGYLQMWLAVVNCAPPRDFVVHAWRVVPRGTWVECIRQIAVACGSDLRDTPGTIWA